MRKSDFTLPTLDDLFSTQAERDDAKLERVRNIPLAELHPFKGHPFKVQNNEEMQRMIESIRKVGAITPALARPLPDGGFDATFALVENGAAIFEIRIKLPNAEYTRLAEKNWEAQNQKIYIDTLLALVKTYQNAQNSDAAETCTQNNI